MEVLLILNWDRCLGCIHEGSAALAGVGCVTGVRFNMCSINYSSHLRAVQFNCSLPVLYLLKWLSSLPFL